jgi:hypothetical protein
MRPEWAKALAEAVAGGSYTLDTCVRGANAADNRIIEPNVWYGRLVKADDDRAYLPVSVRKIAAKAKQLEHIQVHQAVRPNAPL